MTPSADDKLHVVLACGGTGGHTFPGLATAEVLDARGHRVTLWLTGRDIEMRAVAGTPWEKVIVPARGWQGGLRALPGFGWQYLRTQLRSRPVMRRLEPDVVLAMGSYAGAGPVKAAFRRGVPVVLHEANSVPGRMIRLFAPRAAGVGAVFEMTRHALKGRAQLHLTGMPLRRDLAEAAGQPRPERGANDPFCILCMGGSGGARTVNHLVRRAVRELFTRQRNLFVIHLSGTADEAKVRETYVKAGIPHHVAAFESDMRPWYRQADLAICRAGASTCAELAAFGLPALLVPYPHAAGNHQVLNAEEFSRIKAADLVEERDLEVSWLADYLEFCLHNPARLDKMRGALRSWAKVDAAARLADLVEAAARAR